MVGDFGYYQTITGFARGPASGTSSTAQPGGALQLVTPIAITTNLGVDNLIFAFGILTVRFVPEPAAGLLLGVSFALLLAIRRFR
jgi:predicted tellurium resistance membrane protein TerC